MLQEESMTDALRSLAAELDELGNEARIKNAISRENLQMLCPFRACSCAVEGASGNGEEAQLGKTGAK